MSIDQNKYLNNLKSTFESYTPISETSWKLIENIVEFKSFKKGGLLLRKGQIAKEIHFVCQGALRAYITDKAGNIYNKNISCLISNISS